MKQLILCLSLILTLRPASASQSVHPAIKRAAQMHSVNPRLLQAIWLVESSGRAKVKPRNNRNGTKDHGPFQINTINLHKCAPLNVETMAGGARCAARLLKKIKPTDAWTAAKYHSKTPSKRRAYAKKLTIALNGGLK